MVAGLADNTNVWGMTQVLVSVHHHLLDDWTIKASAVFQPDLIKSQKRKNGVKKIFELCNIVSKDENKLFMCKF